MLPQGHRLHKETDIKTLFANGKSVFDVYCGFKYRKNNLPVSRFAVVVGLKVSKRALERNRIRRQLREIIRLRLDVLKPGYDVLVLVRPDSLGQTYETLESHLVAGLKKAGIL